MKQGGNTHPTGGNNKQKYRLLYGYCIVMNSQNQHFGKAAKTIFRNGLLAAKTIKKLAISVICKVASKSGAISRPKQVVKVGIK